MHTEPTIEELAVLHRFERPFAVAVWIANMAAVVAAAWAAGRRTLASRQYATRIPRKTAVHGH